MKKIKQFNKPIWLIIVVGLIFVWICNDLIGNDCCYTKVVWNWLMNIV